MRKCSCCIVEWFADGSEQTGWKILTSVLVGIFIVAIFAFVYYSVCRDVINTTKVTMCGAIWRQPPWIILTGIATGPALLLTWYWRKTDKNRELNQKDKDLDNERDFEIRDRFQKCAEMLSSEKNVAGRIGGIHALADVYARVEGLRPAIVETLTAFVRDSIQIQQTQYIDPPREYRPKEDCQQAIAVLGKLVDRSVQGLPINFWRTDLRRLYFSPGGDFSGANFTNAWVGESSFENTNLSGARFVKVAFGQNTKFRGANLRSADLRGADLSKTVGLDGADLVGAKYWEGGEFNTTFPALATEIIKRMKEHMMRSDPATDDPYRRPTQRH